jgi:glutaredoxin-like protein DUF836
MARIRHFRTVDARAGKACLNGERQMSSGTTVEHAIVDVVLVESEACHLCEDAASVLEAVAPEHQLRVRRVDLASDEGRAIMRAHRAPMPPIVLIGGELLGWGRISRAKLGRRLAQLETGSSR